MGNNIGKRRKADLANMEELAELICVGMNGEASLDDVERVRAWLAANPEQLRKSEWLCKQAADRVVESATTWVYEQENVKSQMEELRTALGYESSNMVEKLVIEQAVLCWARLHFLENSLSAYTKGSHKQDPAHYFDRRVTMAQARYNQALISLAKIRKLKLPDITAIQAKVAYVNASDSPVEMRAKQLLPARASDE